MVLLGRIWRGMVWLTSFHGYNWLHISWHVSTFPVSTSTHTHGDMFLFCIRDSLPSLALVRILFGLGFLAFLIYRLRTEKRRWQEERTRQSRSEVIGFGCPWVPPLTHIEAEDKRVVLVGRSPEKVAMMSSSPYPTGCFIGDGSHQFAPGISHEIRYLWCCNYFKVVDHFLQETCFVRIHTSFIAFHRYLTPNTRSIRGTRW